MSRFIKVADENQSCDFINADQVTKVECSVETVGAVVDYSTVMDAGGIKSSGGQVFAVINLKTANGDGNIRFMDFKEAENWLMSHFNIAVSFDQL